MSKSCQDFSSDLFVCSLNTVVVVVGLHFIWHFSVLFLDDSLKALKCHIIPAPITDVMWSYLVRGFVSAVVAPSSGAIGFPLPWLVPEQPRAAAAKVHPADTAGNLELIYICFCDLLYLLG